MKVKVIDVTGARNLAIGKVYDVVEQKANGNFVITNEMGVNVSFKASRFEVVNDETPVEITYRAGDILKSAEGDKYILISDGDFVAIASMNNGEILNGFHNVEDVTNISDNEMAMIDIEWEEEKLTKVVGCGC